MPLRFSYAHPWMENSAMAHDLERLKQRLSLLEYLQRHNWKPCRAGTRQELVGLCPLHQDTRPFPSTLMPTRTCRRLKHHHAIRKNRNGNNSGLSDSLGFEPVVV